MHRHDHQCQRRSKTFCRYGVDGRGRQRAGLCGAACGHFCRPRLARDEQDRHRVGRQRAGRLPVSAARSRGAPAPGARTWERAFRLPARFGEWRHPVVGLWPLALREDLRKALVAEDLRKIEVWTARYGVALADWPDQPVDPFFNVNTPEDAARAERIALQQAGA